MALQSKTFSSLFLFTRTGVSTVVNSLGKIVSVAAGQPRFDHNPVTLAKRGLLIEPARDNLLLQSSDFLTTWVLSGTATRAGNVAASPDGATAADRISTTSSVTWDGVTQQVASTSSSATRTFSVYVKRETCDVIRMRMRFTGGTTADYSAYFDISTGTFLSATAGATGRIVNAGAGWFRLSITAADNASGNTANGCFVLNHAPAFGDFLVWGAQLEVGTEPTSLIPTTTASASRGAETVQITGSNLTPWFRQDEGTMFVTYSVDKLLPSPTNPALVCMLSTTGNFISIRAGSLIGGSDLYSQSSAVAQIDSASVSIAENVVQRAAFAYKQNDAVYVNNGSVVGTDSLCSFPMGASVEHLNFGLSGFIGHILSARFYPERLPNAELQTLTA